MKKNKIVIFICVLGATLVCALQMSFGKLRKPSSEKSVSSSVIEFISLAEQTNLRHVKISGRIVSSSANYTVQSARTTGRIISVLKREGEIVQKGTKIFEVSSPDCVNGETRAQLDTKNSALDEFAAASSLRLKNLDLALQGKSCFIIADRSGVIIKREIDAGSGFENASNLVTIVDPKHLAVELEIAESETSKVSQGTKVNLYLDGIGEAPFEGVINRVVPTIDPTLRISKAYVEKLPSDKILPLESLVQAELILTNQQKAYRVPRSSIAFHEESNWILKKESSGDIKPVKVHVLADQLSDSLIVPVEPEELKEGLQIISRGAIFALKTYLSKVKPSDSKAH